MQMPLVVALVVSAIGISAPSFAQQKDTVDPKTDQQIRVLAAKYDEAYNKHDSAAVAALYTEDGVYATRHGTYHGREAIQKHWADAFQKMHFSNLFNKRDKYFPHAIGTDGNVIWGNGEWGTTVQGKDWGPIQVTGYWSNIYRREGDTWKILMDTSNVTPAPAATPSPTASPSNQ